MFKVGDYVIKANIGICMIQEIVNKKISEDLPERDYYVLIPMDDLRSKIYVPVYSDASNLRKAMDEDAARKLIRSIPDIEACWIESDKLREKKYKEVMRSNDPVALVSIIKDLYQRNQKRLDQGKKITAVDDRYFKMARNTLYAELAYALGEDKGNLECLITEIAEGQSPVK